MIKKVRKGLSGLQAKIALLSIELLIVLVIFIASLTIFIVIARMIFIQHRTTFDEVVFSNLHLRVSDWNTDIMQFFSFFGSHTFLIPANFLIIVFFLFTKQRWYMMKVPIISVSSLLLMFLLKKIFNRQRPLDPLLEAAKGLSFPSGHALMSVTFYGLLTYLAIKKINDRKWSWAIIIFFALFVFFIGISRIYLRVHYASDVFAGLSLGLVWLLLSITILNKIENARRKEIQVAVETP